MAGPVSQKGTEDKENNRTQNGNKGRHPAKRENKTVKEPKNTRRLWGYKGIRIGEASHPGPGMNEDAETYERKRNMAMGEALKEATVLFNNHGVWKGDNLTRKGNSTGMRLAILNFNRKLYVSDTNINQALDGMEEKLFSETCDERALPLVGSRSESVWKGGSRGGVAGGWNAACQSLVKWYIPGHPLLSPPVEFNHWNQPRHHRFPRHQAHRPGRMPTGTVSDRVRGPCDTRRG